MTFPRLHPAISLGLKVCVSLLALWFVFTFINLNAVLRSFQNADGRFLTAGVILSVAQLVLHVFRWKYLVNLTDPSIGLREANNSFFIGHAVGFITPAQVGEFIGRIASHPGSDRAKILGISVIDKVYIAAMTFVIGGIGLTAFAADVYPDHWHWSYRYIATFLLGIVISLMLYPSLVTRLLLLLPSSIRSHRYYRVVGVLEHDFSDRNGRWTSAMTFATYSIIMVENYLIMNAFADVPFETAMIGTASVLFFKSFIFPFSFSDLGVREGASIFFFSALGISAETAFNTSILITFFNILIPTAIGAILTSTLVKRRSA